MAKALAKLGCVPALVLLTTGCVEAPACIVEPGLESAHHGNAVCYVENDGHVLLIERRFHKDFGLPGGRRGNAERSQCTAARETWEESGLSVIVGPLFERKSNTSVYRCRLMQPASVDGQPEPPWLSRIEVSAAHWIPFAELDGLRWRYSEQHDQVKRLSGPATRVITAN